LCLVSARIYIFREFQWVNERWSSFLFDYVCCLISRQMQICIMHLRFY